MEDLGRWEKTFGGSEEDWGNSVCKTGDYGYILTGKTHSFGSGNGDVWLIRTDSIGTKIFSKVFSGGNEDWGNWIEKTNDNGFIIVGVTSSYGAGSYDVYLVKTDGNGEKSWSKTFGGNNEDWGYSVSQTDDGGFIITGMTKSYGEGNSDVWLIKTDS